MYQVPTKEQVEEIALRAANHVANGITQPMASVQAKIDMGLDPTDLVFYTGDEVEPEEDVYVE